MRIAWLTDPHFTHVKLATWDPFVEAVQRRNIDALLLTGDISEGSDVPFQLRRLADSLARPIYFILGNHDFYQGRIATARRRIVDLAREHPLLHYLTDCWDLRLTDRVGLVGDDGWGDATVGDYEGTPIRLADFERIEDFQPLDAAARKAALIALGREAAERLEPKLLDALDRYETVFVLTHVPPFREACWYLGKTTDDAWAPFFVCGQLGTLLRSAAETHPDRQLRVLCGHTHHPGTARLAANLTVHTGVAQYGSLVLSGQTDLAAPDWSFDVIADPFPERY